MEKDKQIYVGVKEGLISHLQKQNLIFYKQNPITT